LPMGLLLLSSVPLLVLLTLLGGISLAQVVQAVLIVAATALAAGSLGGLVALWRERTFQSLALTVLFLVLYLLLVRGLGALLGPLGMSERQVGLAQQSLDPFLALLSVCHPLQSEGLAITPAYGFAAVMALFCVLLHLWG